MHPALPACLPATPLNPPHLTQRGYLQKKVYILISPHYKLKVNSSALLVSPEAPPPKLNAQPSKDTETSPPTAEKPQGSPKPVKLGELKLLGALLLLPASQQLVSTKPVG